MNIAFFKLTSGFFGGEKQTKDLIDGLKTKGHYLTLITLPESEINRRITGIDRVNFNLFPYPTNRNSSIKFFFLIPLHLVRGLKLIVDLKQRFKIQVACLQEPYEKIIFTPLLRLVGIKVVWLELLYWQPFLSGNRLIFPLLLWSSRWTNKVIVTSHFLRNQVGQYLPASRLVLIKHALNLSERKKFQRLHTSFYPVKNIGFAGSLTEAKGIFILLKAFKTVTGKYRYLKLFFAGSGSDQLKLKREIDDFNLSDRVKLLGKIPIARLFEKIHLLIVPSLYENLPYVIQEAVFSRIGVVATKAGGISELLPSSYRFLAKPNDQIALEDKISSFLELKESVVKGCIKRNLLYLKQRYSHQKMLELTEDTFSSLLKQPNKKYWFSFSEAKKFLTPKNYSHILIIVTVLAIGLIINQVSPYRLPPGEDDMFYLGQVRKTVDLDTEHVVIKDTLTNLKSNTFLFYTLGYLWKSFFSNIDYLVFFNSIYLLFYLAAFLSFIRLAQLADGRLFRRVLIGLWFVLIISNTFWLGPRYFVPSFWLYISIPNIIFSVNKKRWWEAVGWLLSNYLIYWYGFIAGLGISLLTWLFGILRSFKWQLIAFLLILIGFYFFGLSLVENFLKQINFQSVIVPDIAILNYLFASYGLVLILILIAIWYKKASPHWNLIFTSLILTTLFYWTVIAFPNDTASYRLIVIFFIAFAVLLSAIPNNLTVIKNRSDRAIALITFLVLLIVGSSLLILNLKQNKQDFKYFAVRPEEVQLFNQLRNRCTHADCLLVTDIGTAQLASFFLPFAGGQANYESRLFRYALDDPSAMLTVAAENKFKKIVIIASKRTTMLYKNSLVDNPDQWISRSYFLKLKDPLEEINQFRRYSNYLSYANYEIGLYAYEIPVNEENRRLLSSIDQNE